MANQNLSEFTEKLFVADADHTFIWDTVGAISKRVSRNSWLNSGTLTSDAPVTISQTWNNAAVAFTGLKVNAAGTSDANSASGSLLLDLQVGGVSRLKVQKDGHIYVNNSPARLDFFINNANSFTVFSSQVRCYMPLVLSNDGAFNDTFLLRDGVGTLALRNGAAAQTFNVYGTYTSGTSYERLSFSAPSAANAIIGTNKGSGGGTARGLDLHTDGAARMTITTAGNVGIGTTAPSEKLHVLGGKVLFGDAADAGGAGNGELTLRARTLPQLNMISDVGVNAFFGLSLKAGSAERAGLLINMQSGEVKIGALSGSGYFPTFYSNGVEIMRFSTTGNVGIGTTSPTSKLHVAGSSSPSITVDNTLATGASQLLFKNTVVTGDTDGIFLNGSTQTGFGGAGSLNIKATTGPIAFHTASVTNALSIAQSGAATFANNVFLGGYIQISNADGRLSFDGGNKVFYTAANTYIQDLYRRAGSGDPNGTVTAPVGATYNRIDGGAGTSFYVKESGTGNTGWVGK